MSDHPLVQALHAAISRHSWCDVERAANRIRDERPDLIPAPALRASQNTAERLPNSDVAEVGAGSHLADFAELKLLIDEYEPANSDWQFRKSVLLDVLVRIWPKQDSHRPHKVMTREEYDALNLKGWHMVCHDVDGFGGTGVRYIASGKEIGKTVA